MPSPTAEAAAAAEQEVDEVGESPVRASFVGWLTTLVAAAVVTQLVWLRTRQQQARRRTGTRIPLPEPGTPVAALERDLRRATHL